MERSNFRQTEKGRKHKHLQYLFAAPANPIKIVPLALFMFPLALLLISKFYTTIACESPDRPIRFEALHNI